MNKNIKNIIVILNLALIHLSYLRLRLKQFYEKFTHAHTYTFLLDFMHPRPKKLILLEY